VSVKSKRYLAFRSLSCFLLVFILMFSAGIIPANQARADELIEVLDDIATVKNAYVNGSSSTQNGTANNPVNVALDDQIRYTITTSNVKEVGTTSAEYDILFVLDWSNSMSAYMNSSNQMARLYQRQVLLDMCDFVMANYPGSRIAVLALNSARPCYNDPQYTNIQFQTDFITSAQYSTERTTISNAFNINPSYMNDDNATFLKAATDKMAGIASSLGGPETGGAKTIIPRTGDNLDKRIPVIMLMTDFQMHEENDYANNSGQPYWSVVMKGHADRFDSLYPKGVLQMVRFDHINNSNYSNATFDNYMRNNVVTSSRPHWGFTKIPYNTAYNSALNNIKTTFTDTVPFYGEQGTIVTDVVPQGLDVNVSSISHAGSYNASTRTITWDLSDYDSGQVSVEFVATVKQQPMSYTNTATSTFYDNTSSSSNTTYHRTSPFGVTERFRELGNEDNILSDSLDNNVVELPNNSYSPSTGIPPATLTKGGVIYYYYGYRAGSLAINTTLHSALPSVLIPNVTASTTVTYLYVQRPVKDAYINNSQQSQNGSTSMPQIVKRGDLITYEIAIRNDDPDLLATSFTVVDVLPLGLTYVSHTNVNGSSFVNDGQTCTWSWANPPQGETKVSVTARVEPGNETAFVNFATYNRGSHSIETNRTYHELLLERAFEFYKVNENDDPMANVIFGLYTCTDANPATHNHSWLVTNEASCCWGDMQTATSDSDGYVTFTGLQPGTYMLVELETWEAYQLPQGQWLITIDDSLELTITAHGPNPTTMPPAFKNSLEDGVLLLPNYPQLMMPEAGGVSMVLSTVIGICVLVGGSLYALAPAKRKQGELAV